MPRNFFFTTIGLPNAQSLFEVLPGIRVTVNNRDAVTGNNAGLATVYQRETGATTGPSPEAGATSGPNPFITGSSGSIQFWTDLGRYNIDLVDTQTPARMPARTIQWNSVALDNIPGANVVGTPAAYAAGISGADLTAASLPLSKLAAAVLDNFCPIGTMLDYGGTADPSPSGGTSLWLIADGRQLAQASYPALFTLLSTTWNTFDGQAAPTAGTFRLPRMGRRIAMTSDNVSGSGSVPSGLTARARAGVGGAETVTLTSAQSGMPSHGHSITDPTHAHGVSDPTHAHSVGGGSLIYNANAGAAVNLVAGSGMFRTSMAADAAGTGIGIQGAGTGISIVANSANAGSSHENLPPFAVYGPKIIRVL